MMRPRSGQRGELDVRPEVAETLRDRLARGIEHLPLGQQLVLDLHLCRQMSFGEIGQLLLSSNENVRSICTEALGALPWPCRPAGKQALKKSRFYDSGVRHG